MLHLLLSAALVAVGQLQGLEPPKVCDPTQSGPNEGPGAEFRPIRRQCVQDLLVRWKYGVLVYPAHAEVCSLRDALHARVQALFHRQTGFR